MVFFSAARKGSNSASPKDAASPPTTIGDVRMIKSSFGFAKLPFDPEHRLFSNALAGGGILDVGGYPVSMARLIAGVEEASGFLEPEKVTAVGHLGETGVDEWTSALLYFPNGIIAEISCSISLAQVNAPRIIGSKGRIELDSSGSLAASRAVRARSASSVRTVAGAKSWSMNPFISTASRSMPRAMPSVLGAPNSPTPG